MMVQQYALYLPMPTSEVPDPISMVDIVSTIFTVFGRLTRSPTTYYLKDLFARNSCMNLSTQTVISYYFDEGTGGFAKIHLAFRY